MRQDYFTKALQIIEDNKRVGNHRMTRQKYLKIKRLERILPAVNITLIGHRRKRTVQASSSALAGKGGKLSLYRHLPPNF